MQDNEHANYNAVNVGEVAVEVPHWLPKAFPNIIEFYESRGLPKCKN